MAELVVLCGLLVAGAAVFSLAQAWVLGVPPPRGSRYVFIWSVITVGCAGVLLVWMELEEGASDAGLQRAAIILPALTTAAIFWLAGWSRASARPQDGSLLGRAWRLFPTHLRLIIAFAAINFVIIMFLALARIH